MAIFTFIANILFCLGYLKLCMLNTTAVIALRAIIVIKLFFFYGQMTPQASQAFGNLWQQDEIAMFTPSICGHLK
jgi:cell division protein FtsX